MVGDRLADDGLQQVAEQKDQNAEEAECVKTSCTGASGRLQSESSGDILSTDFVRSDRKPTKFCESELFPVGLATAKSPDPPAGSLGDETTVGLSGEPVREDKQEIHSGKRSIIHAPCSPTGLHPRICSNTEQDWTNKHCNFEGNDPKTEVEETVIHVCAPVKTSRKRSSPHTVSDATTSSDLTEDKERKKLTLVSHDQKAKSNKRPRGKNAKRARSKTKYMGVFPNKNSFKVQVQHKGKHEYLGTYKSIKVAARIYNYHANLMGNPLNEISSEDDDDIDATNQQVEKYKKKARKLVQDCRKNVGSELATSTSPKIKELPKQRLSVLGRPTRARSAKAHSVSKSAINEHFGKLSHEMNAVDKSLVYLARSLSASPTIPRAKLIPQISLRDILSPDLILRVLQKEDLAALISGTAGKSGTETTVQQTPKGTDGKHAATGNDKIATVAGSNVCAADFPGIITGIDTPGRHSRTCVGYLSPKPPSTEPSPPEPAQSNTMSPVPCNTNEKKLMDLLPQGQRNIDSIIKTFRSISFLEDVDFLEDALVDMGTQNPEVVEESIKRMEEASSNPKIYKADSSVIEDLPIRNLRITSRKLGISTCNLNKRQLASRITKHLEKIFSIPASSIDAPIYSFRDLKKQTSKKCRGPATSRTRTSTRSVMMKRAHSVARPAAMQSPVSLRITRSSRCNERKEDGGTSESRPGTEKVTERRCGQAGRPGEDEENGYDNFQKMIRPLLSERLKVQRQAPLEVAKVISRGILEQWNRMPERKQRRFCDPWQILNPKEEVKQQIDYIEKMIIQEMDPPENLKKASASSKNMRSFKSVTKTGRRADPVRGRTAEKIKNRRPADISFEVDAESSKRTFKPRSTFFNSELLPGYKLHEEASRVAKDETCPTAQKSLQPSDEAGNSSEVGVRLPRNAFREVKNSLPQMRTQGLNSSNGKNRSNIRAGSTGNVPMGRVQDLAISVHSVDPHNTDGVPNREYLHVLKRRRKRMEETMKVALAHEESQSSKKARRRGTLRIASEGASRASFQKQDQHPWGQIMDPIPTAKWNLQFPAKKETGASSFLRHRKYGQDNTFCGNTFDVDVSEELSSLGSDPRRVSATERAQIPSQTHTVRTLPPRIPPHQDIPQRHHASAPTSFQYQRGVSSSCNPFFRITFPNLRQPFDDGLPFIIAPTVMQPYIPLQENYQNQLNCSGGVFLGLDNKENFRSTVFTPRRSLSEPGGLPITNSFDTARNVHTSKSLWTASECCSLGLVPAFPCGRSDVPPAPVDC